MTAHKTIRLDVDTGATATQFTHSMKPNSAGLGDGAYPYDEIVT